MPSNKYPDAAVNNARRALNHAKENGWGSCGTPVGKRRASQIASRATLSDATIKRVYSFLSRHAQHADVAYDEGCGGLMYDAWGGKSMLPWARSQVSKMENNKRAEELRAKYGENIEIRTAELRAASDSEKMIVEGYAALYDDPTEITPHLTESIARGAFDEVLGDDVRLLLNHDGAPLARTTNGTLEITADENGLFYRGELSDTTAGRDLYTMIQRGDISQSSFAFIIGEERRDDNNVRHVTKISRLLDVSPVSYPAYEATTVSARNADRTPPEPTFETEKPQKMEFKKMSTADLQQERGATYEEMTALMAGIESQDRTPSEAEAEQMRKFKSALAKLDSWITMRKDQEEAVSRLAHVGTVSTSEAKEVRSINKQFSLSRAIHATSQGRALTGAELEWTMEAQKEARDAQIPMEGQFAVPLKAAEYRTVHGASTVDPNSFSGGGDGFVPTQVGGVIGGLYAPAISQEVGVTVLQASGDIKMPKVTTKAGASLVQAANTDTDQVHDEDGATTASGLVFGAVNLTPQRISTSAQYTKQLLIQGGAGVDTAIANELGQAMALEIDELVFSTIVAGLTASAAATVTNHIGTAEASIVTAGARLGNMRHVASAAAHVFARLATFTGAGGDAVLSGGQMAGRPYYVTPNMGNASRILSGDFAAGSMLALFGGRDFLVDPYSNATTGQVVVYQHQYLDAALRQAGALSLSTTITG